MPPGVAAAMARMNGKCQTTSPIPCLLCMTTVDATGLRFVPLRTRARFLREPPCAGNMGRQTRTPPCARARCRCARNASAGQFHFRHRCFSIVPSREDQPMPAPRSARLSRRRVLAAAAAASAMLAAPARVRAQANALKIAVLLPRSGYLAPSGQSCHRGALIAPQVLAQYGYRVELVHIDTEFERRCRPHPDRARHQRRRQVHRRRVRFGRHAGDGAGVRAAPGAAGGQYRGGAATDRAGLEVPGAQFPDRRRSWWSTGWR